MLGTPQKQSGETEEMLSSDDTAQFVSGNQHRYSATVGDSSQFESTHINALPGREAHDHGCYVMALAIQRNPVLVNETAAGTGKVVDDEQTIPIEATTVTIDEGQQPILMRPSIAEYNQRAIPDGSRTGRRRAV